MAKKEEGLPVIDEREKRFAENVWLNYFNRYLFENKVISEKEYRWMTERIARRDAMRSKSRKGNR